MDREKELRTLCEELLTVIDAWAGQLDTWAEESRRGGWSTHQVDPQKRGALELYGLAGRSRRLLRALDANA